MNIGSLIRGLLGDSKPGVAKSLELKEGQIVRGVVLSVSDSGKEAMVQIQGTPVRAELETPLQPGQTMNLQVAAPGEGGLPVLKPVSLGEAALVSPQSMGEALELLGLTDSKAGSEIVKAMQSGGIALTKEMAAKLDAVMNAKPAGVPTSEWLDAAVISVKRGLPVTVESVKGIQQAVFGPQLHQLLSVLEEQINIWVGQESKTAVSTTGTSEGKPNAPQTSAQAGVLNTNIIDSTDIDVDNSKLLGKGNGHVEGQAVEGKAVTAGSVQTTGTVGSVGSPSGHTTMQNVNVPDVLGNASPTAAQAPENEAGVFPGRVAVAEEGVNLSKNANSSEPVVVKTSSSVPNVVLNSAVIVNENGTLSKDGILNKHGDQSQLTTTGSARTSESADVGAPANPAGASAGEAAGKAAASSGAALLAKLQGVLTELRGSLPQLAAAPPADAAGQDLAPAAGVPRGESPAAAASQQQLGPAPTHDTESWVGRVLKLLGAEHEQQAVRGGGFAAAEPPLVQAALQSAVGVDNAGDTLKGVLLQMLGSSEVPPAMKEAAGALVQQLTGQQLLLNTDRTTPFAQVTLFLPLQGSDGQETASVHIQSRRGRKGELDAANCRLWFDLNMKQLGQTLVDVQVVDRIVSLKLHNNEPWVLELLEQRREDIKVAVESIGYQLSALRTEPLPEPSESTNPASVSGGKFVDYAPDAYKGVDYRI